MKKQKSVGLNAILNMIKSGLLVFFPLVTFPYATRVLGVENIGKVNYSSSIVSYFTLFAALGITTYAVREGAKIRDDKDKLARFANEAFTLNAFTACCSYVLLFIVLIVSTKLRDYRLLILLQSLSIVFTTIGVDWLNTIHEDYLLITVRSIVTNLASILVLFLFVKEPNDYYIYAMLNVLTNAIIGISNLYYCRRYTKVRLCIDRRIFRHLKSSVVFFANSLAVSIYVSADTTMLGLISGDYFVGIYAVAVKVYNIIKTLLASLYVVAIPRLSYFVGNDRMDEFKKLYSRIIIILLLLLLPCMAGLISLSQEIILILSGTDYLNAVKPLQILSVGLIFAIFGGAVTNCLNIPLQREMVNMKATIISAITNIVLNLFFITYFQHNGAAFTTVISELIVFGFCALSFKEWKKVLEFRRVLKNLLHAFIGMISVFAICYIVSSCYTGSFMVSIIIKLLLCLFVYAFELIILRNEYAKYFLKKIKSKVLSRR